MRTFWTILLLGVVAYGLTGMTQIRPGERAVVRRFGKVLDHHPEPGLHVGLPWGMDTIDRVAVDRVQTLTVGFEPDYDPASEEVPAGQLLTGDQNLINIQVVVNYRVEPEQVVEYVLQQERVEPVLRRTVEACLDGLVAGEQVDTVLLNGKREIPAQLVRQTRSLIAPYRLGIEVLDARVTVIAPPEEVKRSFDDVTRAQTTQETQRQRAEQDRATRLAGAQAEAASIEKAASGYAYRQRELAEGSALAFTLRLGQLLTAVRSNPSYLRQVWMEERSKLLRHVQENGQLGLLDDLLRSADVPFPPGGEKKPLVPVQAQ